MYINVNGKVRRVPPVVRSRADDLHPSGGTVIEQFEKDPVAVTAWAHAEEEKLQADRRAATGAQEPLAGEKLAEHLAAEARERQRLIDEAHAAEAAEAAPPTPQPAPGRGRSAPKPAPEA